MVTPLSLLAFSWSIASIQLPTALHTSDSQTCDAKKKTLVDRAVRVPRAASSNFPEREECLFSFPHIITRCAGYGTPGKCKEILYKFSI